MIRFLSIRHLAVIDELELDLEPGFTVLTGETGAGKSILLNALGLLIGDRAASDLVRTGEEKAVVQAAVETEENGEVILRREITPQGRSRAFIDDALATAGALQALGRRLVDLHGQHQHQALLDPRTHLGLLDAFARVEAQREETAGTFQLWRAARAALERARAGDRERSERVDLLTFQLGEIEQSHPTPDEDTLLGVERQRLANAERLRALCAEAYGALYESDGAVLSQLGGVWHRVEELAAIDPAFATHIGARDGVSSQLEELAFALRSYAADIEVSPERLESVETRLAELERLSKKYGPGLTAVLDRRDRMQVELESLRSGAEGVAALEEAERRARRAFVAAAERLSGLRQRAAVPLASELERLLADLAIPKAVFEIRLTPILPEDRWSEEGTDTGEFFFSANPGETPRPLARVASGGELSRVMLGLKTLATSDLSGKTLVFDEVDAGIGGAAADRVGAMLRGLGETFQVICVTHLPQIAAYGTSHYHVSKVIRGGRTVTRVERLAEQGRVAELARLMTGGASAQAKASAKELLTGKQRTKGESERAKAKG